MFNFLHTFEPSAIALSVGIFTIHWYGITMALAILAAISIGVKISQLYDIEDEKIYDLALIVVPAGIIGARLYYIFLELPYFLAHPFDIFKIWQGGIAIYGALIGGAIGLWFSLSKIFPHAKNGLYGFIILSSTLLPGIALGQSIGRWGNYFNQEVYGSPTEVAWSIPISPENRVSGFEDFDYFHPVFLYESVGNFLIFLFLISLHYLWTDKKNYFKKHLVAINAYFLLYGGLRFLMEYVRIDPMPLIFGWRSTQLFSLIIVIFAIISAILLKFKKDVSI